MSTEIKYIYIRMLTNVYNSYKWTVHNSNHYRLVADNYNDFIEKYYTKDYNRLN